MYYESKKQRVRTVSCHTRIAELNHLNPLFCFENDTSTRITYIEFLKFVEKKFLFLCLLFNFAIRLKTSGFDYIFWHAE